MRIILGSSSPWRMQIMEGIVSELGLGWFDVIAPDIDEKEIRDTNPRTLTSKLAMAKYLAVRRKVSGSAVIVCSDQVVTWEGAIREKPENHQQARYFLRTYRVEPAVCVTAVYVVNTRNAWDALVVDEATVHFNAKALTDEAIERIVGEGIIFSTAGGFATGHESFKPLVSRIDGEPESVIGLPKKLTTQLIRDALAS